jgi:hypothetical protein
VQEYKCRLRSAYPFHLHFVDGCMLRLKVGNVCCYREQPLRSIVSCCQTRVCLYNRSSVEDGLLAWLALESH